MIKIVKRSSDLASTTLGHVKKSFLAAGRRARRLPGRIKKRVMLALQPVRDHAKGLSQVVGILSILTLTALTAGGPTWASNRNLWPLYIFMFAAIIFFVVLWIFRREKLSAAFASTFGWLPVFLGAVSYGYWYWYASQIGGAPNTEFFLAGAEVLPLLLLAAVVDVRRTADLDSRQLVLPIVAVFLGELAALNALAFRNTGPSDFAAVASSFVSTIVALVLAVMADIAPSAGGASSRPTIEVVDRKEQERSSER